MPNLGALADLSKTDGRPAAGRPAAFDTNGFLSEWGRVGPIFFSCEPISSLSAHACKIWAQSDRRFEKIAFQLYK